MKHGGHVAVRDDARPDAVVASAAPSRTGRLPLPCAPRRVELLRQAIKLAAQPVSLALQPRVLFAQPLTIAFDFCPVATQLLTLATQSLDFVLEPLKYLDLLEMNTVLFLGRAANTGLSRR
jgi:hypothetical protein